ncbi:type III pantothenate kinase [bacterium]|nr:type III pantothenate kinase [bacterium]
MLLTVDIGNTNITLGLFNNEKYEREFRLASDRNLEQSEYENLLQSIFKDYNIDGCVIGSVVEELDDRFYNSVKNVFKLEPIIVSDKIDCGVKIVADNTDEVGADRIANAAAVAKMDIGAAIVVDFGTATTFDIVNSRKEFCGGIIMPGLKTQLKSLYCATSKLPEIEIDFSPCTLGKNTKDAILAGVIRGSACMVDGLVEQCENEMGERVALIATGGYSGLMANYMKRKFDYVNPILTLEGLKYIYDLNIVSNKNYFCGGTM